MVKGDKRNKREYERKNVNVESDQKDTKNVNKSKQTHNKDDVKNPPSNFKGVKEDAAKLISEANERFLEESKKSSPAPSEDKWKKRVVSNWDRYEILSDEENEEDILTGQSWELALGSGSSANAHIKLKGEEGWTTTGDAELSKEFFSLDLGILDNLIKCIPLHQQIDLQEELLDAETLQSFENKATENTRLIGLSSSEDVNDISKKMMSLLTDHKNDVEKTSDLKVNSKTKDVQDKSKNIVKHKGKNEEKNSTTIPRKEEPIAKEPCEDKSKPSDEIVKPTDKPLDAATIVAQSAPQQQRQRRNRNKKDQNLESTTPSESQNISTTTESGPKVEAIKPTETVSNDSLTSSSPTKNKPENDQEKEDLKFLESLDKKEDEVKEVEKEEICTEQNKSVVSVSIIDEGEKKGLEDWLDDFLAD